MLKIIAHSLIRRKQILYLKAKCLFHLSAVECKENKLTTTSNKSEVNVNVKSFGEKVKETTKTASYMGIIFVGVGVTGTLFYAIFKELFSSDSSNNIYSKAVDKCIADPRISDKLGAPIKSFGEQTRRGRRQHVFHTIYEKGGKRYMRMRFYLQGAAHKGTVNLEMMENDKGKYDYRYLYIEIDDMFQSTVILEDNRYHSSLKTPIGLDLFS